MRVMLLAFGSIVVIAVAANLGLKNAGFTAQERQSTDSVRLN